LEAEGANVVGENPRQRRVRGKRRTALLSVAEGKGKGKGNGSSEPGVLERLKSKKLKEFARRTWRRFSGV
jgi:hypothetical protein